MAGDRAAVLSQARAALADGHVLEAVGLLEDRLAHESDPDALRLLGEARHRLGDLGGAGAVWFATSAKGPIIDEAIEAWRTEFDDDFAAMWDSLPAGVRHGPLNPRLAALQARALEATGHEVEATADEPDEPAHRDERVERTERPQPAVSPREAPVAPQRDVPEPHTPPRPRPSASAEVDVPTRPQAKAPEEGGFDAAKVIAWVLAALFVLCAVVGLITILQWIVPGS